MHVAMVVTEPRTLARLVILDGCSSSGGTSDLEFAG